MVIRQAFSGRGNLPVFLLTLSVALGGAAERAFAFHDGGVSHRPLAGYHPQQLVDGIPNNADTPFGIEALLLYENPTEPVSPPRRGFRREC
ncbi:MAG: hypothetical protein R3E97_01615 [Candidatus Eisenbacteria bacterium]